MLHDKFTTLLVVYKVIVTELKVAVTDMRYFPKSKFFGSLVHKKNFGLI